MAVEYVSGTTATYGGGGTTSFTVSKPAGVAAGHVLIVSLNAFSSTTFTAPDASWVAVGPQLDSSTNNSTRLFVKVLGASEPTSYTFTSSVKATGSSTAAAYSGVDNTTPVHTYATWIGTGNANTPAVTTTKVCGIVTSHTTSGNTTWTVPAPLTKRVETSIRTIATSDHQQTAAGTFDPGVATQGTTNPSSAWTVALLDATQPITVNPVNATTVMDAGSTLSATPRPPKPPLATTWGVNLAVAEFGDATNTPGVLDTDYTYPNANEMAYYGGKGFDVVRVPFRWERVHRNLADGTLEATLHEADMLRLDTVIADAQANNMQVLLDMHNYARRFEGGVTKFIGRDIPYADFANAWKLIANRYKANTGIFGYGLMNEPNAIPPIVGTFTGTVLHNFDDGTTQGWQDSNATHVTTPVHSGTGAVRFTKLAADIPAGTGYTNLRPFVATPATATGTALRCFIRKPASTGGVWRARVEWQDDAFAWNTTAPLIDLVDDTWVEISHDFGSIGIVNAFGIQIETNDAPDSLDAVFYMDDFSQGSIEGGTAAENIWPTAAQQATDAIRTVDTTHRVFVCGDNWGGAHSWRTHNENLNIVDSANKVVYEAHQYFDNDSSGKYDGTYIEEGATPTIGVERVQPFLDWCAAKDVNGYIGEYGNPKEADWLTVQKNFLDHLKTNSMGSAFWAGGPWWYNSTTNVDYILSIEPIDNFVTDKPQMNTLEAYLPVAVVIKNASVILDSISAVNVAGTRDKVAQVSATMSSNVVESALIEQPSAASILGSSTLDAAQLRYRIGAMTALMNTDMTMTTLVERGAAVGIIFDTGVVSTAKVAGDVLATIGIALSSGVSADAVVDKAKQLGVTFDTSLTVEQIRERVSEFTASFGTTSIIEYTRDRLNTALSSGHTNFSDILGVRVKPGEMGSIGALSMQAQSLLENPATLNLSGSTTVDSDNLRERLASLAVAMGTNLSAAFEIIINASLSIQVDSAMSVDANKEKPSGLGITSGTSLTIEHLTEVVGEANVALSSDLTADSLRLRMAQLGITFDSNLIATIGTVTNVFATLTMMLESNISASTVIEKARELGVTFNTSVTSVYIREMLRNATIEMASDLSLTGLKERLAQIGISFDSTLIASTTQVRQVLATLSMMLDSGVSAVAVIDKARQLGITFDTSLSMQEVREAVREVGIDSSTVIELIAGRVRSAGVVVQGDSVLSSMAERWKMGAIEIAGSSDVIITYDIIPYVKPGMTLQVKYLTETGAKVRNLIVADVDISRGAVIAVDDVRHMADIGAGFYKHIDIKGQVK